MLYKYYSVVYYHVHRCGKVWWTSYFCLYKGLISRGQIIARERRSLALTSPWRSNGVQKRRTRMDRPLDMSVLMMYFFHSLLIISFRILPVVIMSGHLKQTRVMNFISRRRQLCSHQRRTLRSCWTIGSRSLRVFSGCNLWLFLFSNDPFILIFV